MATHLERTFSIDAHPDLVMGAMRNPEQIRESELSREALDVKVVDVSKDESRHEYDVIVTSHARTVSGIDKSKTERATTRVKWDLKKRTAEWVWTGEHKMVKLNGSYTLREEGAGASLRMTADINVGIPIAGKVVEKKIASGFEGEWPPYVTRVGRFAKAAKEAAR